MTYKIEDLPPPKDINLSEIQTNFFAEYQNSYKNLTKDSKNRSLINTSLNTLVQFYRSLNEESQKSFKNWYQYQVTFIDPTLIASTKIAEIVTKAGVPESLAIDEKGEKFFLKINKSSLSNVQAVIEAELPGLEYKEIK